MGSCCCCCSSRAAELNPAPTYYLYPRVLEEHVPLSPHGAASGLSTGLLVDTNLDTSIPDAYRPPPTPMPFDVDSGRPQTPQGSQRLCGDKNDGSMETEISSSVQAAVGGNAQDTSVKCDDLKEVDCKAQTDLEVNLEKTDVELSKSAGLFVPEIEEEDCPICLEDYDAENPKITTKCEHHFHLACILEWMERSDACPVCDKEMIFDPPID